MLSLLVPISNSDIFIILLCCMVYMYILNKYFFIFFFSTSQGFGVLSAALCSKAIHLLKELLDDLQIEGFLSDTVSLFKRIFVYAYLYVHKFMIA